MRLPTYFIPHGGGPCFFMDWQPPHAWDNTAAFLRDMLADLPQRPRAIALISAHWLESDFSIGAHPQPPLIYDYAGFPPHTYQLRFPAAGDPALAADLLALLNRAGLKARIDPQRGLDHGIFVPLLVAMPQADMPVVPLSLRHDLDPAAHLAAGAALAPLRDQGVLFVGSGMSFHNMRGYGDPRFGPISDRFDAWLSETVALPPAERSRRLCDWASAPEARLCHPPRAEEHLLPLMMVAGASSGRGRRVFSDRVMETTLSAFRFD